MGNRESGVGSRLGPRLRSLAQAEGREPGWRGAGQRLPAHWSTRCWLSRPYPARGIATGGW